MKNTKNVLMTAAALVLIGAPVAALAHCGACGAGDEKTHASEAAVETRMLAIYPLAESAGFTTLTAAIKAAGLDGVLTTGGPFTVFAPTDEAFAKLPEGTVENLLANPEQLNKVLLYHVVSGNVMAADVIKLTSATTLNGGSVAISTKDGVKINDARVVKTDIAASNGTVHVIDTVLIPGNL